MTYSFNNRKIIKTSIGIQTFSDYYYYLNILTDYTDQFLGQIFFGL